AGPSTSTAAGSAPSDECVRTVVPASTWDRRSSAACSEIAKNPTKKTQRPIASMTAAGVVARPAEAVQRLLTIAGADMRGCTAITPCATVLARDRQIRLKKPSSEAVA